MAKKRNLKDFNARLHERRQTIRFNIYRQRMTDLAGPYCAVCGGSLKTGYQVAGPRGGISNVKGQGMEMHEVIIDKGDVQSMSDEARLDINVHANCVLLHPQTCHKQPQPEEDRERCIIFLIEHEGVEKIVEWIKYMRDVHGYKNWEEKVRLVRNAADDMNG